MSVFSHTPTVLATTISRFPYNFFQILPLVFCQHKIHRVMWPSPGTLEGTGTWPDCLVNRDEQKDEGPFGGKICTKIEKIVVKLTVGVVVT